MVPGESIDSDRTEELAKYGVVLHKGLNEEWRVLEIPVALKGTEPTRWIGSVLESKTAIEDALAEAARQYAADSPGLVHSILASEAASKTATRPMSAQSLRESEALATTPARAGAPETGADGQVAK